MTSGRTRGRQAIGILTAMLGTLVTVVPGPARAVRLDPDHQLFRAVHENRTGFLDDWMPRLTDLGNRESVAGFSVALLFVDGRRGFKAGQLGLESLALSAGVTAGLKYVVNRERPTGETVRKNSSFPSGHATGSFALATVLSAQYPALGVPAYLLAAGISYSRVYEGRHYVSDVVAGALVGHVVARVLLHFEDRVTLENPPVSLTFERGMPAVSVSF
jgi:undecaprenyl-diphosphatase